LTEPKPEHLKLSGSLSKKDNVYSQRLTQEGDCVKGNTDIPQEATVLNATDLRTPVALA